MRLARKYGLKVKRSSFQGLNLADRYTRCVSQNTHLFFVEDVNKQKRFLIDSARLKTKKKQNQTAKIKKKQKKLKGAKL